MFNFSRLLQVREVRPLTCFLVEKGIMPRQYSAETSVVYWSWPLWICTRFSWYSRKRVWGGMNNKLTCIRNCRNYPVSNIMTPVFCIEISQHNYIKIDLVFCIELRRDASAQTLKLLRRLKPKRVRSLEFCHESRLEEWVLEKRLTETVQKAPFCRLFLIKVSIYMRLYGV